MKTFDVTQLSEHHIRKINYFVRIALSVGIVQLKFYKNDGTEREMSATTCSWLLGDIGFDNEIKEPKKENLMRINMVDIEKHAWRSFNLDQLISIGNVAIENIIETTAKDD